MWCTDLLVDSWLLYYSATKPDDYLELVSPKGPVSSLAVVFFPFVISSLPDEYIYL